MSKRNLQNFRIDMVDNDRPDAPVPNTYQYTIRWGDLSNSHFITYKETELGGQELTDYMLLNMFLEMCKKAWEESDLVIDKKKWSDIRKEIAA